MGRKKSSTPDKLLVHLLSFRVTSTTYKYLEDIQKKSTCMSVGDVARKLLASEKIVMVHRDDSMNATMEELAFIRKELRSIGVNINQITRQFHVAESDNQRAFFAFKAIGHYKKVGEKVDVLLTVISKLAKKWLQ